MGNSTGTYTTTITFSKRGGSADITQVMDELGQVVSELPSGWAISNISAWQESSESPQVLPTSYAGAESR